MKVVLATGNPGKIAEIREIMTGVDLELLSLGSFPAMERPEETGATFLENATIKAEAVFDHTGIAALADDSGLEVDALGKMPGVKSARYGGEGLSDIERAMKLLEALGGVPEEERTARFRCLMVLHPAPGGGSFVTEGILEGRIALEPAGENGFGYDPVFLLPEMGMTVAELEPGEKNRISHRYRALIEMKALLAASPKPK
jgi:XTP/dITP diphosphohydrolase